MGECIQPKKENSVIYNKNYRVSFNFINFELKTESESNQNRSSKDVNKIHCD